MSIASHRRERRTARVFLFGPDDRILLFRYVMPGYDPFWTIPGGGCDPGEEFDATARRELFEETGIKGAPHPLGVTRTAEFMLEGEPVRSVEHFYCERTNLTMIETSNHTALEREVIKQHRWFAVGEFADWAETVYPENIVQLFDQALERL